VVPDEVETVCVPRILAIIVLDLEVVSAQISIWSWVLCRDVITDVERLM
jgi:hypothetical protein